MTNRLYLCLLAAPWRLKLKKVAPELFSGRFGQAEGGGSVFVCVCVRARARVCVSGLGGAVAPSKALS